MNVINIAHGAFIMLGAYLTYWLFVGPMHLDPFLSIPLAMLAMFVLAYLLQRVLVNQVIRAPMLATFLLTFGISIMIANLAQIFWSSDIREITTAYSGTSLSFGGLTVPWVRLWTLLIAIVLTIALQAFMTRSKIGRAIRSEYVIAYDQTGADNSGKWHSIQVRVDQPQLRVYARRGYYAQ